MATEEYAERLLPGVGTWFFIVALVAMISLAYGGALGAGAGWAAALCSSIVALALILVTSPRIRVAEGCVSVGRARLPLAFVSDVEVLDAERTTWARDHDARAYLVLRPMISRASVQIHLEDPEDPHPYWLVTSRHADRLASSLVQGSTAEHPPRPLVDPDTRQETP